MGPAVPDNTPCITPKASATACQGESSNTSYSDQITGLEIDVLQAALDDLVEELSSTSAPSRPLSLACSSYVDTDAETDTTSLDASMATDQSDDDLFLDHSVLYGLQSASTMSGFHKAANRQEPKAFIGLGISAMTNKDNIIPFDGLGLVSIRPSHWNQSGDSQSDNSPPLADSSHSSSSASANGPLEDLDSVESLSSTFLEQAVLTFQNDPFRYTTLQSIPECDSWYDLEEHDLDPEFNIRKSYRRDCYLSSPIVAGTKFKEERIPTPIPSANKRFVLSPCLPTASQDFMADTISSKLKKRSVSLMGMLGAGRGINGERGLALGRGQSDCGRARSWSDGFLTVVGPGSGVGLGGRPAWKI